MVRLLQVLDHHSLSLHRLIQPYHLKLEHLSKIPIQRSILSITISLVLQINSTGIWSKAVFASFLFLSESSWSILLFSKTEEPVSKIAMFILLAYQLWQAESRFSRLRMRACIAPKSSSPFGFTQILPIQTVFWRLMTDCRIRNRKEERRLWSDSSEPLLSCGSEAHLSSPFELCAADKQRYWLISESWLHVMMNRIE